MVQKARILVGTKLDLENGELSPAKRLEELRAKYPAEQVLGISVFSGEGIPQLGAVLGRLTVEAERRKEEE
jgi:GTP-binding protein